MYIVVEDFKVGLDRRRKQISGVPGALWDCENAHISRGGDIEKRKAFVSTYALPAGLTFGLYSLNGNLYTFGQGTTPGSMPVGVNYQQLAHPLGQAMTRLLSVEAFNGQIYAIATYADGSTYHFYNGSRVTTWDALGASVASNTTLAAALALRIDADPAYIASAVGAIITVTAQSPGTAFTTAQSTVNYGSVADQTITITPVIANVPEVVATGTVTITGGSAGAGNYLSSVTVNGVQVLGANVLWTTSHDATAALVAAQINLNVSTPEYTAVAVGAVVTISAAAGTGSGPNGFVVAKTDNGTLTSTTANMASGVSGVAQVTKFTIGGTFEAADQFTITLAGVDFILTGVSSGTGTTAIAFKSKVYSTASSLAYFSALNNPASFGAGVGSGFLNLSNFGNGSQTLTAIAKYQGNLAFFSRNTVQVWFIDTNEDNNDFKQSLDNTGTVSPRSISGFGNNDVFYLAPTGVRSLRARDASNAAFVSDTGTNIDPLVVSTRKALSDTVVQNAVGVIEPVEGRYMLALGPTVFVFSYFPGSKVSAWSTYLPGFTISDFAIVNDALYARSGDTVYQYGGAAGETYDSCTVKATLPFLTSKKPGTKKKLNGFDLACENTWDVHMLVDPRNTARMAKLGTVTDSTYVEKLPGASLESTHFAPQLTCTQPGAASLSSVCLHYELLEKELGEGDE